MTALLLALQLAAAQPCAMAPAEQQWAESALAGWEFVRTRRLLLSEGEAPQVVLFDKRCRFERRLGRTGSWSATPHSGQVRLPDGARIPPAVTSFAGAAGTRPFFVMALPSVWREAGVESALGLEVMMEAVLIHEIMHTRQSYFATPRLAALTRRYKLPDDISDDSLQARFKDDPAYVAAYEKERDLLYAAAAEPDLARARALAREALAAMRARQARWFTGKDAVWKPLDDIFLTMEGVGQWAAYAWISDPHGRAVPRDAALREIRRGKKWWSQDQGLALFLVIDRLLPGWQKKAFAPKPTLGIDLLADAVR